MKNKTFILAALSFEKHLKPTIGYMYQKVRRLSL